METVKEMRLSTSLSLGKPDHLSKDYGPLLGLGILASSGPIWVHQMKIIAPQLYLDKVKIRPFFCFPCLWLWIQETLKKLTMVIQETLRLYPPAAFARRQALEDIKLKNIMIPKGMNVQISIPILQHDVHLWDLMRTRSIHIGSTMASSELARIHRAYMTFGVGPRVCAGQNFAMVELKVIVSLVVSRFEFSLSPSYNHSPAFRLN